MKVIKELTGYSGSTVLLLHDGASLRVRKINNIDRNLERLQNLQYLDINLPRVLCQTENSYDMPYIPHQDMITWLLHNPIDHYVDWIITTIEKLQQNSVEWDWTKVYINRLDAPGLKPFWAQMAFSSEQLIARLPKILPKSHYHGDLTVENCIFSNDGEFYLIDPITTDYASWVFDIAKLQQDLVSCWFIRDQKINIYGKLWDINSAIIHKYPQANNAVLQILMLLRVLPYTKNILDKQFLTMEINRLWTL